MKKLFIAILTLALASCSQQEARQWSPVGENIRTQWAAQVDPECVLPEYPRPQMVRTQWQNLNGLWDYSITKADTAAFDVQGHILIPFAVESCLSGVGRRITRDDALWYEREFTLPKEWKGRDIMLNFGAVDWYAEVFVNGKKVGEHKGGYDPFSFNITPALKTFGKQTLTVKVQDATDNSFQPRGKQIEYPGIIWYTPVSGIWQTVWMEPVSPSHINSYYTEANLADSRLTVKLNAETREGDVVKVELLDGSVGYTAEAPSTEVIAGAVAENGVAVIDVPEVKAWSTTDPYLYGLRISIVNRDKTVDSVEGYAAMREVGMKTDKKGYRRMTLNDEFIFHFGPLDQGWWPDGLYTAPTDEALKWDIIKTKDFGFNMIRKHIKAEPARWYYYCDVLGMMVWQDMPCIGDYCRRYVDNRDPEIIAAVKNKWGDGYVKETDTECAIPQEWKDNFYNEWTNIMNSLRVFPSIVMWVPFNEAWGQFDTKDVVEYTRKLDSTRIINEASGGNYAFVGDVIDIHNYPHPKFKTFDKNFVNVVGEYGGIGWPVNGHTWIYERTKWGYGGVEDNSESVMKRYLDYVDILKDMTYKGNAGAVYTQTTDVEVEVNGLITYDRAIIKVDEKRIHDANQALINQAIE